MAVEETRARHETLGLGDDDLLKIYHHMLLARRVDERMWTLNRQGKAAFVISCQGQEAAQVGAAYNLRPGRDYVYPYYRDSGITMLLGQTARDQFLSLLGKKEDRKSTRLNSSHANISYAVFCLKKKKHSSHSYHN